MQRRVCNLFTGLAIAAIAFGAAACGSKEKAKVAGPERTAKPEQQIQAKIQPAKPGDEAPPSASPIDFDLTCT